jgi:hypothetical protein
MQRSATVVGVEMEVKICLLVLLIGLLSVLYHAGKPGEASEAKSA